MEAKGFVIKSKATDQFLSFYTDNNGEPYIQFQNDLIDADFLREEKYFLTQGRNDYYELNGLELEAIPVTITIG